MATKSQNVIIDGSSLYFIIKPFKTVLNILAIFLSLIAIALFSLLYFLNPYELLELLKKYNQSSITTSGFDQQLSETIYTLLSWITFDVTQIRSTLYNLPTNTDTFRIGYRTILINNLHQLELLNVALHILSMRLSILISFSFFILSILLALAAFDGWMERKIRTACLGRESSSMYHQAKFWRTGIFVFSAIIMLSWPGYIEQIGILLSSAVLVVVVFIQAKYYKKYI